MRHEHSGTVTIVHKLDPAQFDQIIQAFTSLIAALGTPEDAAAITALTAKLKTSDEALSAAVAEAQP